MTVIINEGSDDCRQWLDDHGQDFDLDVIVRTTPSSYASFELVAARLAGLAGVDHDSRFNHAGQTTFRHFVTVGRAFPE